MHIHSLIGLAEEVWPIREAASHKSRMDEVELLLIKPQIFGIIDDKLEIRWDADPSLVCAQW